MPTARGDYAIGGSLRLFPFMAIVRAAMASGSLALVA